MKRLGGLSLAALVMLGLLATMAQAAPKPKLFSTAWELDFQFQDPTPIRVSVPGEPGPKTYWYVLYTVTNRTGQDQIFVPQFTLYTDTGQVVRADRNVSPSVYQAIQRRHGNPLLQSSTDIAGRLLQGLDNARDGVAIFTDIAPDARVFDVFVSGLSGERAVETLPVPVTVERVDPTTGQVGQTVTNTIVLHKTRQVTYRLPGEAAARMNSRPEKLSESWVMR